MCWHNRELQRDIETYDMVKYIGGVLGFDMVDLLDTMTYNPIIQTEDDVDNFFFGSDHMDTDNTINVEYSLEVDEAELESIIEELNEDNNNDSDDDMVDLTVEY